MEKLIVIICKGNDGYGTWIEDLPSVYGKEDTVENNRYKLKTIVSLNSETQ
jgi:hypothetical protein